MKIEIKFVGGYRPWEATGTYTCGCAGSKTYETKCVAEYLTPVHFNGSCDSCDSGEEASGG